MTIIVGILCNDGCVLASDGMASNNLGNMPFVGIENTKIHKISEKIIVSCAGDDNLMSLFLNFLEKNHIKIQKENSECATKLATAIGSQFANQIISTYNQYPQIIQEHYINNIRNSGFNFAAIIAFELNDMHYMFTYDHLLKPSIVRNNGIWYNIIGSGELVAKPSIHLVKKILKIKKQPDIKQGSMLAYWTISHAIEVSSGAIGGDISLFSLKKNQEDNKFTITESDSNGFEEMMTDMYKHIWEYQQADDSKTKEIPTINNE